MLEAAWISDTSDQIHTLSDFGLVIIIWAMLSTVGIL